LPPHTDCSIVFASCANVHPGTPQSAFPRYRYCPLMSRLCGHVLDRASQGDLSLDKFNVTLDCFCGWPNGTLVDCTRRNPDVRPTGNGARRRAGKSQGHPLKSAAFPVGIWTPGPHLIHSSLGTSENTSQTASRSVQPFFCTLQGSRSFLIDRPTDHATHLEQ